MSTEMMRALGDDSGPAFFKILFVLEDFNPGLRIPPAFVSQYEHLLPKKATFETNVSKKLWDVNIEQIEGQYWLGQGWNEFVKENALRFPKFLVFRIVSESRIRVTVFDSSGNCIVQLPVDIPGPSGTKSQPIDISEPSETKSLPDESDGEGFVDQFKDAHISENKAEPGKSSCDQIWTFKWKKYMMNQHMPIGKKFIDNIGLRKDETIHLKNSKGIYPVKLFGTTGLRLGMGSGWKTFVRSSKFQLENTYQFEYINPGAVSGRKILELSLVKKNGSRNIIFNSNDNPCLDFEWKDYMNKQLPLKRSFFEVTGLIDQKIVRMLNLKGEEFGVSFSIRNDGAVGSGKGWAPFRGSNGFVHGRTYRVEFVPSSQGGLLKLHEL